MRVRAVVAAVAAVAVSALLGGCTGSAGTPKPATASTEPATSLAGAGTTTTTEPGKVLRIGVIAPVSAAPGIRNSVELAVRFANEERRIAGYRIEVVVADDRGRPGNAAEAAERMVDDGRVIGVIGPTSAETVRPALPAMTKAGLGMVVLATDDPTLTRGPESPVARRPSSVLYRGVATESVQGPVAADFVLGELHVTHVVIVKEDTPAARRFAEAFERRFQSLAGTVAATEVIGTSTVGASSESTSTPGRVAGQTSGTAGGAGGAGGTAGGAGGTPGGGTSGTGQGGTVTAASSMDAVAERIVTAAPGAVVFAGDPARASAIAAALRARGFSVPMIGDSGLCSADPSAGLSDGDLCVQAGPPTEVSEGAQAFREDYAAARFEDPPGPLGAAAYDAANLLIDVAARVVPAQPDLGAVRQAMPPQLQVVARNGTTGPLSFDQYGDLLTQVGSVLRRESGTWTPLGSRSAP